MSRQDTNAAFANTSFLYGGNADYIDELYARYEAEPESVDAQWRGFFASLKDAEASVVQNARGRLLAAHRLAGGGARRTHLRPGWRLGEDREGASAKRCGPARRPKASRYRRVTFSRPRGIRCAP